MPEQPNHIGRGPLGVPTNSPISDPGTSARIQNRPHRTLGTTNLHAAATPLQVHHGRRRASPEPLPQLQIGNRGQHVQRLQRLLNSWDDGPKLKVDGIFGPKTRAAVIDFQKSSDLRPDGVVGRMTWFVLITEPQASASQAKPIPVAAAQRTSSIELPGLQSIPNATASDDDIESWSLGQRFEYVLRHTPSYLKGNLQSQFQALLTPGGIATLVGSLVVLGASQFIGIGEILDGILLLWAGFSAGRYLGSFVAGTCFAKKKSQLEEAANDLALAVEIIGVAVFFALLSRVARFLRGKIRGGKEGGPPTQEETPPPPKKETSPEPAKQPEPESTKQPETQPPAAKAPERAQDTADWVDKNGGSANAPQRPGYTGGRAFRNDGRGGGEVLPRADANGNPVNYREWDVNPRTPGVNRGPERVVTGSDGSAYYTDDHYQTFTKIK